VILNGLSVVRIGIILSPVVSTIRPPNPDPFAPAPLQRLHRYY
jgi:hypothetical protein